MNDCGIDQIHTLICRSHLNFAIPCLESFRRFCAGAARLILHDDGSLHAADFEEIARRFPESTIVSRREADERMERMLKDHPRLRAYRREHPLALKLLDVNLLSVADKIAYCDTDVLFLKSAGRIFELDEQTDAVFMCDLLDSYSLRSWQILRHRVKLLSKINTGVFCVRRSVFDLDRLERLFSISTPRILNHFREQTAWAHLAAYARTRVWDPARLVVASSATEDRAEAVAIHFVSTYRSKLLDRLSDGRVVDGLEVPLALMIPKRCTAFRMLRYELSRRISRQLTGR